VSSPSNFELAQLDAVAFLRTLPSESVDIIVTDPAYESLEKHRAVGTTTRLKVSAGSSNTWFSIFPNVRFAELFEEVYRVLKRDTHFYLMCDPETAFIAKPIAEQAGFKFWKPLVWDKCLAPQTPVRSDRGVIAVKEIKPGDRVYTPDGRLVSVLATRDTKAPALRIALSTGTVLTASEEHRFQLADGTLAEAKSLRAGTTLAQGVSGLLEEISELHLDDLLEDDERIVELPSTSACLFCGKAFESSRAASAHQARFCEKARSKESMATELGVATKRLRRWLNTGRLPASWAEQLGLSAVATGRSQLRLQNDMGRWFEPNTRLDYGWGKLIGLFAAEGHRTELDVSFALHSNEKHLQNHILRIARSLGLEGRIVARPGEGVSVHVSSKVFSKLVGHFVGGANAKTKHFLPPVFEAPAEFRRGVFDGLIEGDGHWSREEQRETVNLTSLDLASFVLRYARSLGWEATMRKQENEHAGFWRVRFDPAKRAQPITVVSVETAGETELVDIAIDDAAQLYELYDGTVTHNCSIGMGYHYRARYEFVLFFEKGKRRLADLGIADVLPVPRIRGGYPAEKPSVLSEILLRQSSVAGDLLVDPFMGSGSSGVAALTLGRRFAGNDVSPDSLKLARERLLLAGGVEGPVVARPEHPEPVQQRLALG
jgi:DNA modification methylase